MKKTFTILGLLVSTALMAQTQVLNPGFESWSAAPDDNGILSPDNWEDEVACFTPSGGSTVCTTTADRTTDAYAGTYALRQFTFEQDGDVNYATFSNLDFSDFTTPAFTGRPTSATFYYKYKTDDNQPMIVSFELYTGDITSPTVIGSGSYSFSTAQTSYLKVDVPITYFSTAIPSNILITSDYHPHPATGGDTLLLDEFSFNYSVTGIDQATGKDNWSIYTSDKTLHSSLPISQAVITDVTGKTVASFANTDTEFSIPSLKAGIYIVSGMINDQPVSRRLFIE